MLQTNTIIVIMQNKITIKTWKQYDNRHNRRETRSTGTVHTSAKACLTSVAILIRIGIWIRDLDRQSVIRIATKI